MSNYYESEDLKKFGDIGQHAKNLADDFFKYYGDVTGTDGALSKREKALIALAVSHAQKCPYCIDAYTTQCLETGANPEQMMEAVHVAAVMQAGITLVHSVQMQNHLKKMVLLTPFFNLKSSKDRRSTTSRTSCAGAASTCRRWRSTRCRSTSPSCATRRAATATWTPRRAARR